MDAAQDHGLEARATSLRTTGFLAKCRIFSKLGGFGEDEAGGTPALRKAARHATP